MRKILSLAYKELGSYFKSPIAYILLLITLCVFNFFFFMIVDQNREATLRDVFKVMEFMFVFIIPLLTMRVFAEEKRRGTMEFLLTSPISEEQIVLGKFIGSFIFISILIGLTSIYYGILAFFGKPEILATLIGYAGILLEAALFIAIGMLMSSWTKNQIVAGVVTYCVLMTIYFSMTFIKFTNGSLQLLIHYSSVWSHSENLFSGFVSASDLMYFLSGIVFFLLLTRISLHHRP